MPPNCFCATARYRKKYKHRSQRHGGARHPPRRRHACGGQCAQYKQRAAHSRAVCSRCKGMGKAVFFARGNAAIA